MRIGITACGILLLFCLIFTGAAYAQEAELSSYKSPEGINFVSNSTVWNEQKLKGLYEILLRCGHGEELSRLKQVILSPEKSKGKSGSRVGNYDADTQTIRLFEVESIPVERTLIHEYGHHFTYYWLQKKEGITPNEITESSSWAQARQLTGFPIRWSGSMLPYDHKWDPGEIMAEDYVLLFGVGGETLPEKPQKVVNLLRHENEYIPQAQSMTALRRYWEELAGLTPKESIRMPIIKEVSTLLDSDERTNRLVFSSAATNDQQLVQYGIQVTGYNEQSGIPVVWSTGVTAVGKSAVEAELDLHALQGELSSFSGNIQIWALDPLNRQLVYTPFYMNWFSFDSTTRLCRAIPPSFESRGLMPLLKKEGIDKWPLMLTYINGISSVPVQRYEDRSGNLYVPIRLFNEDNGAEKTEGSRKDPEEGRLFTIKFKKRSIQLHMDEDLASVNGTQLKLKQRISKLGGREAMVAVADLPQLLGVAAKWDEESGSLFVESPN
jgi:hypothetical protein